MKNKDTILNNLLVKRISEDTEIYYDENERPIVMKEPSNKANTYNLTTINPDTGQILSCYQYYIWNNKYGTGNGIYLSKRIHWIYSYNPYVLLEKISINEYGKIFRVFSEVKKLENSRNRIIYYFQVLDNHDTRTEISSIIETKEIHVNSPNGKFEKCHVIDKYFKLNSSYEKSHYYKKYNYDEKGNLVSIAVKDINIFVNFITILLFPFFLILEKIYNCKEIKFVCFTFLMTSKKYRLSDKEIQYSNCWEHPIRNYNTSEYSNFKFENGAIHPLLNFMKELNTYDTFLEDKFFKNGKWTELVKH